MAHHKNSEGRVSRKRGNKTMKATGTQPSLAKPEPPTCLAPAREAPSYVFEELNRPRTKRFAKKLEESKNAVFVSGTARP